MALSAPSMPYCLAEKILEAANLVYTYSWTAGGNLYPFSEPRFTCL